MSTLSSVGMAKLTAWITAEQAALWHDLDSAIHTAVNGIWSMQAEAVARRLFDLLKLGVEPTPWGEISWDLVTGGIYGWLLMAAGWDKQWITIGELIDTSKTMDAHFASQGLDPQGLQHRRARYDQACIRMIADLTREDG